MVTIEQPQDAVSIRSFGRNVPYLVLGHAGIVQNKETKLDSFSLQPVVVRTNGLVVTALGCGRGVYIMTECRIPVGSDPIGFSPLRLTLLLKIETTTVCIATNFLVIALSVGLRVLSHRFGCPGPFQLLMMIIILSKAPFFLPNGKFRVSI